MAFRMGSGQLVAGLMAGLVLTVPAVMAEPMERSLRPLANPSIPAPAMPVPAMPQVALSDPAQPDASLPMPGAETLKAKAPISAGPVAALPGQTAAALTPAPDNPGPGAVTLSSADRAAAVAAPAAEPDPLLPELGEMLPATMPGPDDFRAYAALASAGKPAGEDAAGERVGAADAAGAKTSAGAAAVPGVSKAPGTPEELTPRDVAKATATAPVAVMADAAPSEAITPKAAAPKTTAPEAAGPEAAGSEFTGLRPKIRPAALEKQIAAARGAAPAPARASAATALPEVPATLLLTSLRPKQRPGRIVQLASAPAPKATSKAPVEQDTPKSRKKEPVSAKGSVCGVAAIKGEKIAPITSKVQGCGLADGVRVTSVSGVRLSMAATIDCSTAKALNTWVERAAQPAYGNQIVELQIAGHYVCRPRNNKKGAKVSEHGRGKAVDIAGFRLASGKVIKVLGGFDQTMRKAHKAACGIFGTTLGPGSDGYHEDHLHFDTASHRSGAYCR